MNLSDSSTYGGVWVARERTWGGPAPARQAGEAKLAAQRKAYARKYPAGA